MDSPVSEMPRYKSHKIVHALEIGHVNGHIIVPADRIFNSIDCPAEMFVCYVPVSGDFLVVYPDGYRSFSPRAAFVEGYSPV